MAEELIEYSKSYVPKNRSQTNHSSGLNIVGKIELKDDGRNRFPGSRNK